MSIQRDVLVEVMPIIKSALEQVAAAKSDADDIISGAFSAHGIDKKVGKAIIKAATAEMKDKKEEAQSDAETLLDVLGAV